MSKKSTQRPRVIYSLKNFHGPLIPKHVITCQMHITVGYLYYQLSKRNTYNQINKSKVLPFWNPNQDTGYFPAGHLAILLQTFKQTKEQNLF